MTSRVRSTNSAQVTTAAPAHARKPPGERRAEILRTAARIGLEESLERITLRRVADELGVRPGLIGHYFPADDLVSEAFAHAAGHERDSLLPAAERALPPLRRLARFLVRLTGDDCLDLGRLWLNARHLSRFKPGLRAAVSAQEAATRTALTELIEEGVRAGAFTADDPLGVTVQILVTVDGLGSYANADPELDHPVLADMALATAERLLGLAAGTLRAQARN